MQSPKSQRSKAPGEKPASDNNPETVKGGSSDRCHAPAGATGPSIPAMDRSTPGRHQGNTEAESYPETHKPTPSQAGGAGYAKGKENGPAGGGSVHQT